MRALTGAIAFVGAAILALAAVLFSGMGQPTRVELVAPSACVVGGADGLPRVEVPCE